MCLFGQVIRSLCMTLSKFQEDPTIPVFGFGDIRTKDKDVFPLLLEVLMHIYHAHIHILRHSLSLTHTHTLITHHTRAQIHTLTLRKFIIIDISWILL